MDGNINNLRMLGFATPALPLNSLVTAVFVFLPALYAEYVGLGAATVGSIFLAAKIVDVFVTPLWGLFMDNYPTRWGRRRPWLALSTPALMIAVYMLFNPPATITTGYLIFWLIALYIAWDAWTISHTAWAMEMSSDYDERSRITGLLQMMVMTGGVLVSLIPAILERLTQPDYETKASIISAFIIIILPLSVLICLLSANEKPIINKKVSIGFKQGLSIVIRNSALTRLLLTNGLLTFCTYFLQGLFVFFVSYTLNLADWVGLILVFLLLGGLFCVPIWIKLSIMFSKHRAIQIAMLVGGLAPLMLLVLSADTIVLAVLAFLIIGANSSANEFLPRTMLADVCDQDRIQSGSERMGLYYSLLILSSKLAAGVGIFIGFSFLGVFGFEPSLGLDNTPESIERLRYLIVIFPAAAYIVVMLLMWRYPITRERQQAMREKIEQQEVSQDQS